MDLSDVSRRDSRFYQELENLLVDSGQDPEVRFEGWNYLKVDYEFPHVERLWKQYEDGRLFLHRLLPIPEGEQPLYHPHPWSSWVVIVKGSYYMDVGTRTRVLARGIVCSKGGGYVMEDPEGWHSVSPRVPTLSIMWAGGLYENPEEFEKPENPGIRLPMSDPQVQGYLKVWRDLV